VVLRRAEPAGGSDDESGRQAGEDERGSTGHTPPIPGAGRR
jgi:hypothetical protein